MSYVLLSVHQGAALSGLRNDPVRYQSTHKAVIGASRGGSFSIHAADETGENARYYHPSALLATRPVKVWESLTLGIDLT